jgi:hypothetical protein
MEAVCVAKTLVPTYLTARYHYPEIHSVEFLAPTEKVGIVYSSEALATTYQTKRGHNPEGNMNPHRHERFLPEVL